MRAKKITGSAVWIDPDDAPFLTKEMLGRAEVFAGNQFIGRPRGRPKAAVAKEHINIRLDADVLACLRGNGPGWQTKVNEILRTALGLK